MGRRRRRGLPSSLTHLWQPVPKLPVWGPWGEGGEGQVERGLVWEGLLLNPPSSSSCSGGITLCFWGSRLFILLSDLQLTPIVELNQA